jgi:hypothetical protein
MGGAVDDGFVFGNPINAYVKKGPYEASEDKRKNGEVSVHEYPLSNSFPL